MTAVAHRRSPDEPEGGWLSPAGPNGWPDLEELDLKQRAKERRRHDQSASMGLAVGHGDARPAPQCSRGTAVPSVPAAQPEVRPASVIKKPWEK